MADQPGDKVTVGFRTKNFFSNHWRGILVVAIPVLLLPLIFVSPVKEFRCMYTVLIMAFYWISELIPLYVTSLIPIIAFPVFDILDSKTVCESYCTDALMLFITGLIVALSMEYSNLHNRIAIKIILLIGCSPRRLHFGMILAATMLSMWISNSATTAMFVPIIKAILTELNAQGIVKLTEDKPVPEDEPPYPSKTVLCYYLGVAYAASIGGCGTLIGTGTNLTYKGLYETRFPEATDITFLTFMMYGVPPMVFQMLGTYLWLQFAYQGLLRPKSAEALEIAAATENQDVVKGVITQKNKELGRITMHEIQVSLLFIAMIVLLFVRKPGVFPGYADYFSEKSVKGSVPLTLVAVLLFILPVNYSFLRYLVGKRPEKKETMKPLLSWDFVQKNTPWGLLLLLGGGFALAKGVVASGFAKMVGEFLSVLRPLPAPVIQLICILIGVFMTAFSSNVAICNILVPVIIELSIAIELHPLYLTFPTAMACSLAFHLPVSTPPNAIVAGFANIRTKQMAFGGIGATVVCIVFLYLFSQTLMFVIFPQMSTFPDWAKPQAPAAPPAAGG